MSWTKLFNYDATTGVLTWKIKAAQRLKISDVAGRLRKDGYLQVTSKNKSHLVHRIIWDMLHPDSTLLGSDFVDHIDHNRINNRPENLRKVTRTENARNQTRRNTNTSGATGIYWVSRENKWNAQITVNYKTKHLGYFERKGDAIAARKKAEKELGFHKNHGEPKCG